MYYLSIITVAYNNKDGLIRTRDSILPLPDNCEWIIIDAASTDGTKEILNDLPKQNNIRWISEPDKGLFDGMNKGVDLAKGKYLNFMNSGDFYNRSAFEEVCKNEYNTDDIIVYDYFPVNAKLEHAYSRKFTNEIDTLKKYDCVPHQSTLISYKTFKKIGKYDLKFKYTADYEYFVKAYTNNCNFKFDESLKLAYFVQDGITGTLRLSLKQGKEVKKIQLKYFKTYSKKIFFIYIIKYIISFLPQSKKIYDFLRVKLLNKKNFNEQ